MDTSSNWLKKNEAKQKSNLVAHHAVPAEQPQQGGSTSLQAGIDGEDGN